MPITYSMALDRLAAKTARPRQRPDQGRFANLSWHNPDARSRLQQRVSDSTGAQPFDKAAGATGRRVKFVPSTKKNTRPPYQFSTGQTREAALAQLELDYNDQAAAINNTFAEIMPPRPIGEDTASANVADADGNAFNNALVCLAGAAPQPPRSGRISTTDRGSA